MRAPTVRLALTDDGVPSKKYRYTNCGLLRPEPEMPDDRKFPEVRLAHVPGAQGDNNLLGRNGVDKLPEEKYPALLVSYVYLDKFIEKQQRYAYRDWVLDSGAFSAYNSGKTVTLELYTETAKLLLENDPTCVEVFALDVIGDHKASLKNAEYMWSKGVSAVPTFHCGEPWDFLLGMARDYPKIALGAMVGQERTSRFRWIQQCFARVWPKKVHGFGLTTEDVVLGFPFHSVDSTDWEIKPAKFGHWRAFGSGGKTNYLNWRGSNQNLLAEVEYYLNLEERARIRWKREMELLESLSGRSPTVRLATGREGSDARADKVFNKNNWKKKR